MKKYLNLTGNSGVTAYQSGRGFIKVIFGETEYRYTLASAGKEAINTMKKLAAAGRGLSTYISRHVKERYETKRDL